MQVAFQKCVCVSSHSPSLADIINNTKQQKSFLNHPLSPPPPATSPPQTSPNVHEFKVVTAIHYTSS